MLDFDASSIAAVRNNGGFYVGLFPYCPNGADATRRLPPLRLVIAPLVARASAMRIFGWDETSTLCEEVFSLGTRKRAHIEVDLTREVVKGHEALWNTGGWNRGAIVLAANVTDENMAGIFTWCSGPGVWTSLHQVKKGSPTPAIKYAQSVTEHGLIGFCLSASNGIQWMDVFPPPADLLRIFEIARTNCRPFKRFVEHNPDENEIIYDRAPYSEMT